MKRVLIISYYWPPAGGISIIRPLKLVKYIRDFGWEPVVCTADGAHYPLEDENASLDIPEDLEILKVPIVEPYGVYKKLTGQKEKEALVDVIQNAPKRSLLHNLSIWIRGNFFIPDARCLWINPAVKELKKYLKENPVDAIITTGPPHSVNRIGYLLKKDLGLPWLADFQDPWTQVDYYKHFKISSWAHRRHQKMEKAVFDHADCITIVSNSWKRDLKSIGAKNVSVVPLGYDPVDFSDNVNLDKEFSITHLGLLGEDRNPETLFRVLADICKEEDDFASKLKIKLIGKVNPKLLALAEELGLAKQLEYMGQVSRVEALEYMQSSQILLLLLNKAENVSGRIPGKVFEYLGAQRPILSLGPRGTDIEKMLVEAKAGENIEYEEEAFLRSHILSCFDRYKKGGLQSMGNSFEALSHSAIAGRFAYLLEQINTK